MLQQWTLEVLGNVYFERHVFVGVVQGKRSSEATVAVQLALCAAIVLLQLCRQIFEVLVVREIVKGACYPRSYP